MVAHPFASMLLGLGTLTLQLGVAADDPAVARPLSWHRALRMGGEEAAEFAAAPLRALGSLLSDSWLAAV